MKFKTDKKIYECIKFKDRLLGFMFKSKSDYALKFNNCNSIHTFFMIKNVDVYMCDENGNIIYKYLNLKPFKIVLPKKNVTTVYEILKN